MDRLRTVTPRRLAGSGCRRSMVGRVAYIGGVGYSHELCSPWHLHHGHPSYAPMETCAPMVACKEESMHNPKHQSRGLPSRQQVVQGPGHDGRCPFTGMVLDGSGVRVDLYEVDFRRPGSPLTGYTCSVEVSQPAYELLAVDREIVADREGRAWWCSVP